MAVRRRARQLTGEDEMDEVVENDGGSFTHSPDLVWRGDESRSASARGKKKVRFPWQDFSVEQMRRLGNTNQVKKLHNVFRLRVLQASLSRHSREHTPHQNSPTGQEVISGFIRSRLVCVCVCVCVCLCVCTHFGLSLKC